jgi:hypothetical protein
MFDFQLFKSFKMRGGVAKLSAALSLITFARRRGQTPISDEGIVYVHYAQFSPRS